MNSRQKKAYATLMEQVGKVKPSPDYFFKLSEKTNEQITKILKELIIPFNTFFNTIYLSHHNNTRHGKQVIS